MVFLTSLESPPIVFFVMRQIVFVYQTIIANIREI